MIKSKVKVCADENGAVINISENPEIGYIVLEQTKVNFKETGWINKQRLSCLIFGEIDELKSFGWVNGMEIPGNIVIQEQLEPFNENDPERDYKIAGDTGIVCCIEGQPIYRKSFYDSTEEKKDNKLQHTNGDAIREKFLEELDEISNAEPVKKSKKNQKNEELAELDEL